MGGFVLENLMVARKMKVRDFTYHISSRCFLIRFFVGVGGGGCVEWTRRTHDDVIKWKHFPHYWSFCAGNSPVNGEFPTQRPVTRSFGIFFDLRPNKRLSKQSWGWWFETPSCPLWRHCNEFVWPHCCYQYQKYLFNFSNYILQRLFDIIISVLSQTDFVSQFHQFHFYSQIPNKYWENSAQKAIKFSVLSFDVSTRLSLLI